MLEKSRSSSWYQYAVDSTQASSVHTRTAQTHARHTDRHCFGPHGRADGVPVLRGSAMYPCTINQALATSGSCGYANGMAHLVERHLVIHQLTRDALLQRVHGLTFLVSEAKRLGQHRGQSAHKGSRYSPHAWRTRNPSIGHRFHPQRSAPLPTIVATADQQHFVDHLVPPMHGTPCRAPGSIRGARLRAPERQPPRSIP
jgi:hypothetical protein